MPSAHMGFSHIERDTKTPAKVATLELNTTLGDAAVTRDVVAALATAFSWDPLDGSQSLSGSPRSRP